MSELTDAMLTLTTQFKAQNDIREAEAKKFGDATAETNAKVDRLNDSISAMEAKLEAVENRVSRPGMVPGAPTHDEQVDAFKAWMRTGIRNAAMTEGTDGQGGYTVPTPMATELLQGLQAQSIFRQIGCPVKQMTSWKMDWPTLTNSTTAIQVNEEGNASEVEPTIGTVAVQAYKFSKLSKVSKELAADSIFDVWGQILSPDFAQAFAKAENATFTTGTGGAPNGVVTGGTAGVTAAATTAVTSDELIDLFYALDYRHQSAAKWMMANSTVKLLRKLKDDDGQYLWAPGFAGEPPTILGQPLIKNDSMPAATAGLKPIIVGDFSYFYIFDREGFSLQRLNELYAYTGQIGFLAEKRFDSHVMLATAFQYITMKA